MMKTGTMVLAALCAANLWSADIAFVGDSATAGWRTTGAKAWKKTFASGDYAAENLATGEMKAENFAAAVAKDGAGLDGKKVIVLSIGTDDIGTGAEHGDRVIRTVFGVKHAIAAVMKRCPAAKVVLVPILPRGATAADPVRQRLDLVNGAVDRYLARMKYERLSVCFINRDLLDKEGNLRGIDAYGLLAAKLKPHLDWALGKAAKAPRRAPPGPTGTPRGASRADTPSIKDHWISDNFFPNKKNCRLDFRYEEKFAEAVKNDGRTYDVVMVGDSITHLFDRRGKAEWEKLNKEFSAFDLGFGGDHTENALWNILYGGFFDHIQGKVVTLMIGTNNRKETAEQVADGIKACVEAINARVPKATIFLHPMLPRISPKNAELRAKNDRTNELIKPLADGKKVVWVDLRPTFEGPDVTPERQKELLPDGTHPSEEGFRLWREAITPHLRKYAK